jgi:CBS domain containing-hemolysin-like protein
VNLGLALTLVAVLIAANGLFVAAEFALVATRRGVIDDLVADGDRRARLVLRELHQLSFVLSLAQFGITATSLVVGFLAEEAVGGLLAPAVTALGLPAGTATGVTITGAFLLSTMLQMVFGELAPKNLAISRPEPVALAVAPWLRAFELLLGPVVRVFDAAAGSVSRRLFGVEHREELLGGHSLEDLSRIISASGEEGALTAEQASLLQRAVDLGNTRVSAVMVPRPDVVWLDRDATLEDVRRAARATGHSRFPVRGAGDDEVLGTIHIKDLLRVPAEARATTPVAGLVAEPLVVPESDQLHRLLGQFRRQQRTFAVVVDEFGGIAGIVTVEDLVEELVGEIEDEFDRDAAHVRRVGVGRFVVQGTLRADRVDEVVGVTLPEGDYETVAGFVIERLGHIPAEGEAVVHDGWEFLVTRLEGVRVAELRVRRLEPAPESPS